MCNFFSAIYTKDGRVLFTEEDSHERIVQRAKLKDDKLFTRRWVRVELQPKDDGGWQPLTVDENGTLPGWFDRDEAETTVREIAARVRPAWAAYVAVMHSAQAAYDAAMQPARAVYAASKPPAWAPRAAYYAAMHSARVAYAAAEPPAWAAYDAAVQPAWTAYIQAIQAIPGYVTWPHERRGRGKGRSR